VNERIPLPWCRSCFVCGADNPVGLRARCYKAGDAVELPFTTRREHCGWSEVLHGGLIATVLDEVMTWAAILGSDRPCFAAEFSVRLLEPLPSGVACVATGRLLQARRRVFDVEGQLADAAGRLYARATGRYLPAPRERLRHLREDFVSSDACLDLAHIFDPRG
jgi:acyl-coenzyme A thioesterase PaaI-like protein